MCQSNFESGYESVSNIFLIGYLYRDVTSAQSCNKVGHLL
jgi:hypothetical protein